jgi:hypothetical protein
MIRPDAHGPILLFMRNGDTEEHVTQVYAEAHR